LEELALRAALEPMALVHDQRLPIEIQPASASHYTRHTTRVTLHTHHTTHASHYTRHTTRIPLPPTCQSKSSASASAEANS
jgi:hypothetical protein